MKKTFILFTILSLAFKSNSQVNATALDFDGINDYVSFAPIDLSLSNKCTIEAWVKPDNITSNLYCNIARQDITSTTDWLLAFQQYGAFLAFGVKTTSGYTEINYSITASSFTDGNWHHVAGVYNGTVMILYVDGSLVATQAKTGNITLTATVGVLGSRAGSTEFYDGKIDEVRIWNTAHSACEVAFLRNIEIPASSPGLLANFHLNEGTANATNTTFTTTLNASGNANNGTLGNFALTGNSSNFVQGVTGLAIFNGASTVCVGSSSIYSISPVTNTTTYNWQVPSGWAGTSATNTISITANASSGTLSLTVSNPTCTAPALLFPVAVNPCTGIKENGKVSELIKINPNPVAGNYINIIFNEPIEDSKEVKIFDMSGKCVYKIMLPDNEFTINIQSLDAGIYVICIQGSSYKFIRQ